jgi:glycosyltransferase involved in cell wall biosynthesis
VTSTPLSVAGGSGTFVGIRQLVQSLEERGVRVQVHAPAFRLPSFTAKRLLFNFLEAPRLRRGGYDWVVGFDLDGFQYGRTKTAPYIASIKGVIADELRNERGVVRAMLGVQAAFERLAVLRADVVVATSQYSRDRIVEAYGVPSAKVRIVPEPIDLQAWDADETAPIEMPAAPPAILSVAHMYPRKNLGALLEAYAHLQDAGIPFQGWIVGEGPCRSAWERLRDSLGLAERVKFFGSIPRRDLENRYRQAALFCLPSRQEGFGIVFLEAMACGKAVVAGRRAAVPETVMDGETGLLVDPEDPAELAEALAKLLQDGDLRHAMGAAGRRRVQQYASQRVAEIFLTTVQTALRGCRGPTVEQMEPADSPAREGRPSQSVSTAGGGR